MKRGCGTRGRTTQVSHCKTQGPSIRCLPSRYKDHIATAGASRRGSSSLPPTHPDGEPAPPSSHPAHQNHTQLHLQAPSSPTPCFPPSLPPIPLTYLVLEELIADKPDDQARLPHRRVPQEDQLEMAHPVVVAATAAAHGTLGGAVALCLRGTCMPVCVRVQRCKGVAV